MLSKMYRVSLMEKQQNCSDCAGLFKKNSAPHSKWHIVRIDENDPAHLRYSWNAKYAEFLVSPILATGCC